MERCDKMDVMKMLSRWVKEIRSELRFKQAIVWFVTGESWSAVALTDCEYILKQDAFGNMRRTQFWGAPIVVEGQENEPEPHTGAMFWIN